MSYMIRPIQLDDLNQVFVQLVELVKHEGLSEFFKLTPERMAEELFRDQADWFGLVAVQNNCILGFCLYGLARTNRSFNLTPLIHIDHLYVDPKHRALGIARKLLQHLARIAEKNTIDCLELWCMKSNDIGQRFYQKLHAEKLEFLDVLQLDVPQLIAMSES